MIQEIMGVFKRFRGIVESYFDELLSESGQRKDREDDDEYLKAAYDELNEFIYGKTQTHNESGAHTHPANDFDILGVRQGASLAECKEAYRKLVKMYHPDRAGKNAAAPGKFIEIQEAYKRIEAQYAGKDGA